VAVIAGIVVLTLIAAGVVTMVVLGVIGYRVEREYRRSVRPAPLESARSGPRPEARDAIRAAIERRLR
jgi:hypothetical protein